MYSVWGILNAPATGEAMSELILDGAHAVERLQKIAAALTRSSGVLVTPTSYQ